ncbi:hypothetical protein F4810DRAFT_224831 [Camillea tinctor]|nr:hypothetical protein F4810DRAFT_224831 [Camillea tinctor]
MWCNAMPTYVYIYLLFCSPFFFSLRVNALASIYGFTTLLGRYRAPKLIASCFLYVYRFLVVCASEVLLFRLASWVSFHIVSISLTASSVQRQTGPH